MNTIAKRIYNNQIMRTGVTAGRSYYRYAPTKLFTIVLIVLLSSCANLSGDEKIIGYWKDGACKKEIEDLYVVRFIDSEKKLKEIINEHAFEKKQAESVIRNLVEAKSSQGGRYAEISATRRAWKGLYGAWRIKRVRYRLKDQAFLR